MIISLLPKVKSKKIFKDMTVFTGYVIVKADKKYLYSKFSQITRLTAEDALTDANLIKTELLVKGV